MQRRGGREFSGEGRGGQGGAEQRARGGREGSERESLAAAAAGGPLGAAAVHASAAASRAPEQGRDEAPLSSRAAQLSGMSPPGKGVSSAYLFSTSVSTSRRKQP